MRPSLATAPPYGFGRPAAPGGQKQEPVLLQEEDGPVPAPPYRLCVTWIRRIPNVRLRLALAACALGYLLLHRSGPALSWLDWWLALISLVLGMVGGTVPFAVALAQPAVLLLAERYGHTAPIGIKVIASIAVFEVTLRRWGWRAVPPAAALTGVYIGTQADAAPSLLYKVAVVVGGPALLAAYIRSMQQAAHNAQERAEEANRAARMAERTAIARELHDMVAHHMASIALRAGVARHVVPQADPRVTEVLDDVHASATTALADLRRLVAALREPGDPGRLLAESTALPEAVAGLVERARQAGLALDSSIAPELGRLDALRGLTLLRLVQEGLTNAVKHGGPDASVRLRAAVDGDGTARLEIRNDGADSVAGNGAGHGVLGMRERVDLVGGTLEAGPDGGGWRLAATLPEAAR